MSYLEKNISQNHQEKIDLPDYLKTPTLRKIAIPSFLTHGTPQVVDMEFPYRSLREDIKNDNISPYACGTTCEVTPQICKECTTCQGCEDNCQHGACEGACMLLCEVNTQCGRCQVVSQDSGCAVTCEVTAQVCKECTACLGGECIPCESIQCGSCESDECIACEGGECDYYCENGECRECGFCENRECASCERLQCRVSQDGGCLRNQSGSQHCPHTDTEWTAWTQDSVNLTICKSELVCKKCGEVLNKRQGSHITEGTGHYEIYDREYHQEICSCIRCGAGAGMLERHLYKDGKCIKCGAREEGGGVPVIKKFDVEVSSTGMKVSCKVEAENAFEYKFVLYDGTPQHVQISSSGMITENEWNFNTVPNTYYLVNCTVYNDIGEKVSANKEISTPLRLPSKFTWAITPEENGNFSRSITSQDWNRLQQTINAWRNHYNLEVYKFTQIPMREDMFSIARKGEDFTFIYYNQIINALTTIPQFKGKLPSKLSSNPVKWKAKDFVAFQNAVNSFLEN